MPISAFCLPGRKKLRLSNCVPGKGIVGRGDRVSPASLSIDQVLLGEYSLSQP